MTKAWRPEWVDDEEQPIAQGPNALFQMQTKMASLEDKRNQLMSQHEELLAENSRLRSKLNELGYTNEMIDAALTMKSRPLDN